MSNGIPSTRNNQAFGCFKNYFNDQSCVISGTGPSLLEYKPISGAIHIGCNRCLFLNTLIYDIYFFNDWDRTTEEYRKHIINYKPNIKKFFGTFPKEYSFGCSEEIANMGNATLYDMEGPGGGTYQKDIDIYCVGDGGQSTVFVQMQFALFSGFKTIYIVGCDIDNLNKKNKPSEKYFYNVDFIKDYKWYAPLKKNWNKMKTFIDTHYPEVEIISINPLGLKGLFKDEYQ